MADKDNTSIVSFKSEVGLADYLNKTYFNQIKNFFSDEKKALKFLSSVRADVQRNPKLLECTATSIVNSYMTMAQMGFMPSGISGESYVLPYKKNIQVNGKWETITEAQLQIGYQGLVTLYYGAGVEKIISGIVRKNDKTTLTNGELTHEVDLSKSQEERGEPIGAYVSAIFRGEKSTKYMNGKDIIAHAMKYSKSYDPKGKYSPWNPENDRELWMWVKTVIKQHKLLPKNEIINKAIAIDNKDSVIADRFDVAKLESESLNMGNLQLPNSNEDKKPTKKGKENKKDKNEVTSTESNEDIEFYESLEQGQ